MSFHLIEFDHSSGGGLAVVHKNWLTPKKTNTLWPPYREQSKYNRALRQGESGHNWQLYKVKRIFYTCDDYEKIHEKLKNCQTSDIQSDAECNIKRKRIPPRRLYSESEDEEGSLLPRTTKVSKIIDTASRSPLIEIEEDLSPSLLAYSLNTAQKHTSIATPGRPTRVLGNLINKDLENLYVKAAPKISKTIDSPSRSPLIQIEEDLSPSLLAYSLNTAQKHTSIATPGRQTRVLGNLIDNDLENLDVKATLYNCVTSLVCIKEQNKEILAYLQDQQKRQSGNSNIKYVLPDLPVQLAVSTVDELKALDGYLSENNQSSSALVAYLSTLGGRDVTNKTNRILKYLITNEVATNYNYYGKRSMKSAFFDLHINQVIIDSVKRNYEHANNKDIEDVIKVWLKHAPERVRKDSKE